VLGDSLVVQSMVAELDLFIVIMLQKSSNLSEKKAQQRRTWALSKPVSSFDTAQAKVLSEKLLGTWVKCLANRRLG